jgi:rhamnosyltransferase
MYLTDSARTMGVVILYKPEENVIHNIESYISSLGKLLIIQNSKLPRHLVEYLTLTYKDKIAFKSFDENTGISIPLNFAMKYAKENGFQYLLTMDQDSRFNKNDFSIFVKSCIEQFNACVNIALCSPAHSIKGVIENDNIYPKWVMTSGNIINIKVFGEISFNEQLFIDGVDFEICMKITRKNLTIFQINNIVLEHELGDTEYRYFCGKKIKITNHNTLRLYYIFRNYLFLIFSRCSKGFRFSLFKLLIQFMIAILFFEKHKYSKIKASIAGVWAFINKNMGKKNDF